MSRLKLTIEQLNCKIDLLDDIKQNEIEKYKNIIEEKDRYIRLIESTISLDYANINRKLEMLCIFGENK